MTVFNCSWGYKLSASLTPPVPGFADPRFAMSDRSYVLIIEWDDTSWRWRVHERRHMGIRWLFTRYSGLIYPLPPHYRVQLYTDQLSTFGHVHPSVSSTFGMHYMHIICTNNKRLLLTQYW